MFYECCLEETPDLCPGDGYIASHDLRKQFNTEVFFKFSCNSISSVEKLLKAMMQK